jgi:hemoglobin/transferrin/lactoferrin receptor protein
VERELKDIPLSVSVVSSEEIKEEPRQDAFEYVRTLPGVQVNPALNGQNYYNIRGFGHERVLLLVDGVKQKFAATLSASSDGGANINPSEIERVEVIKGPGSVLYGSDAIGGVVNIITKKRPEKPFGFNLGLTFDGSTSGWIPSAAFYGTHESFYFRFSGWLADNDDLRLPDGKKYYHTQNRRYNFAFRGGYDWDNGNIDISLSEFKTERNLGAFYQEDNTWKQLSPKFMARNGIPYSRVPEDSHKQAVATLTLNNLSNYLERLTIKGFTRKTVYDHESYYPYVVQGVFYNAMYNYKVVDDSTGYGGDIQADFSLPGQNKLTVGVDYDIIKAHNVGVYSQLYNALPEDRQGETSNFAVFAQNEWRPLDSLIVTAGLRYTTTKNEVTKYKFHPERQNSAQMSATVGTVGLVYQPTEALSLRALYSQGFRTPTLSDQLMSSYMQFLPNPDLSPEKSNNYELGLRYFANGLDVDVAFFYSRLKDAFYYENTGKPMPNLPNYNYFQTRNSDRATSAGAEVAVSYEIPNIGLIPYVSMTFMRYKREYANGNITNNAGVPRSWGVGGFKYSKEIYPDFRLFGDASLNWSGKFFDEPANGVTSITPIYHQGTQVNFTIGFEAGEEHKYRGVLSLRNIGDNKYEPYGFFQPGFHVVATIGFEY